MPVSRPSSDKVSRLYGVEHIEDMGPVAFGPWERATAKSEGESATMELEAVSPSCDD